MNQISFIVGRFQPYHIGHEALVKKALSICKKLVIFLGSSNESRTDKNPLTADERAQLILTSLDDKEKRRVTFVDLPDFEEDCDWLEHIRTSLRLVSHCTDELYTYVCCHKDKQTSFYNDLISAQPYVDTYSIHNTTDINATDIRLALKSKVLLCNIEGLNASTYPLLEDLRLHIQGNSSE